jgi:hypothetical protein
MKQRVTMAQLKLMVARINQQQNTPATPWKWEGAKSVANIGCYYLDGAYGGWKLARIVSEGGAATDVTYGFVPKRELLGAMSYFFNGLVSGSRK